MEAYKLPVPAAAPIAANLTPDAVQQLLMLLRAQGINLGPLGIPGAAAPTELVQPGRPASAETRPTSSSNGNGKHHGDPRAVLPLDNDERGFRGF